MYTILIADDEVNTRDAMTRSINWTDLGISVAATAGDGTEAYEKIMETKPDLVLIDIVMPGMTGLDVIRRIKTETDCRAVFVIMSGYDEFSYARQALEYRVARYLLKPFTPQELKDALTYALSLVPNKEKNVTAAGTVPACYSAQAEQDVVNAVLQGNDAAIRAAVDAFCARHFTSNPDPSLRFTYFAMCYGAVCKVLLSHEIESVPKFDPAVAHTAKALKDALSALAADAANLLGRSRSSNQLIADALTFIETNYTKRISLNDIAEQIHISPNYLSNLFTEVVGKTITTYIQEQRIENAKRRLLESSKSVAEISSAVGYTDIKYFIKVFKRCTGMSPAVFRKNGIEP